jgi:hypothetical protein
VPTIVEYSLLYNSKKLNETLDAIIIARKIVCGIPSPSYDGLWCDLKGFALIRHKSWFCVGDLTCCVRGTGRKYCFDYPINMANAHRDQLDSI